MSNICCELSTCFHLRFSQPARELTHYTMGYTYFPPPINHSQQAQLTDEMLKCTLSIEFANSSFQQAVTAVVYKSLMVY